MRQAAFTAFVCFLASGCNTTQIRNNNSRMREAILQLQEEQLFDNLVRVRCHQPILHIDYVSISGSITQDTTLTVGGSDTIASTTTSLPLLLAQVAHSFAQVVNYAAILRNSDLFTVNASVVTDNEDPSGNDGSGDFSQPVIVRQTLRRLFLGMPRFLRGDFDEDSDPGVTNPDLLLKFGDTLTGRPKAARVYLAYRTFANSPGFVMSCDEPTVEVLRKERRRCGDKHYWFYIPASNAEDYFRFSQYVVNYRPQTPPSNTRSEQTGPNLFKLVR